MAASHPNDQFNLLLARSAPLVRSCFREQGLWSARMSGCAAHLQRCPPSQQCEGSMNPDDQKNMQAARDLLARAQRREKSSELDRQRRRQATDEALREMKLGLSPQQSKASLPLQPESHRPHVIERVVIQEATARDPRWSTHSLAMQSLITGVCSILFFACVPLQIISIATGVVVLHRSTNKSERAMAWVGVILGAVMGSIFAFFVYVGMFKAR